MNGKFLKLNENKTEVIIFGSPAASTDISTVLGPLTPYQEPVVKRTLGCSLTLNLNLTDK